jgi:hypothetical protein
VSDQNDANEPSPCTLPVERRDPVFGYKPNAGPAQVSRDNGIIRFIFAAFEIGAGAHAIAQFLNDLDKSAVATPPAGECE